MNLGKLKPLTPKDLERLGSTKHEPPVFYSQRPRPKMEGLPLEMTFRQKVKQSFLLPAIVFLFAVLLTQFPLVFEIILLAAFLFIPIAAFIGISWLALVDASGNRNRVIMALMIVFASAMILSGLIIPNVLPFYLLLTCAVLFIRFLHGIWTTPAPEGED